MIAKQFYRKKPLSVIRPTGFAGVCILFILLSLPLYSQTRIFMDGRFSDWQDLEPAHIDGFDDQLTGTLDFDRLWLTNDENYLFVRIEVGSEINLQDLNEITLFLDTDADSTTGRKIYGIGAELEWHFGEKSGTFRAGNTSDPIMQAQIGIVTAPTITSTEFEIALDRQARPVPQTRLFSGNHIRVVFKDQGPGQDLLPDRSGGIAFTFNNTPLAPLVPLSLGKIRPGHLRILSYNVLDDGIFDPARKSAFTRILQAIKPDLIGFQEIYNHNARTTLDQINTILPLTSPQQWYGAKVEPDIIAVSKYPILTTFVIEGAGSSQHNGAFLIDPPDKFGAELLFIVAHPPCCGNNIDRQYEIDAIMAFIRDARTPGGQLDLPAFIPIVIAGDLNLVGLAEQLTTLLTGKIVNRIPFGDPFAPDWDDSHLADLVPRHTDLPLFFTWYSTTSSYSPGRLDFIIYTDSVLEPCNHYILFTPSMSPDTLQKYSLLPDDASTASDHLPVVCDFKIPMINKVGWQDDQDILSQISNYPNPFNFTTTINYSLTKSSKVVINICNLTGQRLRTLVNSTQPEGEHSINWDGKNDTGITVSSGIYFYSLETNNNMVIKKLLFLR